MKAWEPVVTEANYKHVDQLADANDPAARITQLTVDLGAAEHEIGSLKSDVHGLQNTVKELKARHRADRERLEGEKARLEARLAKFEAIDDGSEGEPGSQALAAARLEHKREMEAVREELEQERKKRDELERKVQEWKSKYSGVSAELSRLKFEEKHAQPATLSPQKPAWMSKVAAMKHSKQAEKRERVSVVVVVVVLFVTPLSFFLRLALVLALALAPPHFWLLTIDHL